MTIDKKRQRSSFLSFKFVLWVGFKKLLIKRKPTSVIKAERTCHPYSGSASTAGIGLCETSTEAVAIKLQEIEN